LQAQLHQQPSSSSLRTLAPKGMHLYPIFLSIISYFLILCVRPFCPDVSRCSSAFLLLLHRQPSPLVSSHCRLRWWLRRIACARDSGSVAVIETFFALLHVKSKVHCAQWSRPLSNCPISSSDLVFQQKVNTSIFALAQFEIDMLFSVVFFSKSCLVLFTGCCHRYFAHHRGPYLSSF
jgi:hypothetical protein